MDSFRADTAYHPTQLPGADPELDILTPREVEVLTLIAHGYTYREAATELHVSTRTIETHGSAVLRKLQLSNDANSPAGHTPATCTEPHLPSSCARSELLAPHAGPTSCEPRPCTPSDTYLEELFAAADTDPHDRPYGEGFLAILERNAAPTGCTCSTNRRADAITDCWTCTSSRFGSAGGLIGSTS